MITEYVGRSLPPSPPYQVGREKVREFALAVGEGASVCTDLDAARAAGHPDLVAPPTFAATFIIPMMERFLRTPAVDWDYSRMVHGEQSFTMHRPIFAGDELVTTVHVDEVRTRASSVFLTLRFEVVDATEAPVLTAVGKFVTLVGEVPS